MIVSGPLLPMLALATPLALALLAALPGVRPRALSLLPLAPLPALGLALAGPTPAASAAPDVLLGVALGLDGNAAAFLGFAALLWALAGLFARAEMAGTRKPAVFTGFWCLTLAGNLGVFLAWDVATFYVAFAAVSLAAYVLVVHDGTEEALRAGRIYLVLAVVGEACLLAGFLVGAAAAPSLLIGDIRAGIAASPLRDVAVALLIAGFGLKAGLMPLHVWLPLAHPAAPTPASAVLSGAIVKAGIFGLIVFLPGELPAWGALLLVLGLASAFLAVLLGLVQPDPKAVLAYSTISQMGLVIAAIGAGIAAEPGAALAAATLASTHHGLAKGALFLTVGVVAATGGRHLSPVLAVAAVVALSVAGLPLTGGALSKAAVKAAIAPELAVLAVTLSGAGTGLLLLRFLLLLPRKAAGAGAPPAALVAPWAVLAAAAVVVPWFLFPALSGQPVAYAVQPATLRDGAWPVALAAVIAAAALRLRPSAPAVPEGDLAVPLERAAYRLVALARDAPAATPGAPFRAAARLQLRLAGAGGLERALGRWSTVGLLLVALALALVAALAA